MMLLIIKMLIRRKVIDVSFVIIRAHQYGVVPTKKMQIQNRMKFKNGILKILGYHNKSSKHV